MSETTTVASSTPEQAPVRESLETLAAAKHTAFAAKVNGSIFGKERTRLQEAYDQAENAYIDAIRTQVTDFLETQSFESIDQQISAFEELVNSRLSEDRAAQQHELIAQGGKRAEFLAWYANLPRPKKLAATIGLAAGGATLGFALSTLGAGVATVAAGVGAYRLARGYNMRVSKLYSSRNEQPVYTATSLENTETSVDHALSFLRQDTRSSIERAEKIKKRAIVGAVGAVALGSVAGYGLREAVDDTPLSDKVDAARTKVSGWAQKLLPYAEASTVPSLSIRELQENIPSNSIEPINQDYLSGHNQNQYGTQYEAAVENQTSTESSRIAQSFTVEKGHGYTHELMETVKDAYGVELTPEEAWELHKELVRTAGVDYIDLLDHNGSDTYSMGDSRYDVGIAHGGEAEWSDKAVKLLDEKYTSDDVQSSDIVPENATPDEAVHSHATERNQIADAGLPEAENEINTVESNDPKGIVEARDAAQQGTDGISWSDMKNDAYEIRGMLLGGDIESINNDVTLQNTLEYIRHDIGNMTYPGTDTLILEKQGTGFMSRWVINDIPEGSKLPDDVIRVFDKYINRLHTLAP